MPSIWAVYLLIGPLRALRWLPDLQHPPPLATAIRQTGWRACSTAGTHSLDQGQTGVDDTIRALDRAGVAHAGTFSSAPAQHTPLIMTVKGVRVAFLAYTELTDGIPSPHRWSVNRASAAQVLSDAHRARTDGAQAVIVNIHRGDQYVAQDGMIVLLTITVDSRGARVTFIRYVPIGDRHPDFVVLPAGVAWRTDPPTPRPCAHPTSAPSRQPGAVLASSPIPDHLLSAARPVPRITSQRTGRQRKGIAPGVRGAPAGVGKAPRYRR